MAEGGTDPLEKPRFFEHRKYQAWPLLAKEVSNVDVDSTGSGLQEMFLLMLSFSKTKVKRQIGTQRFCDFVLDFAIE